MRNIYLVSTVTLPIFALFSSPGLMVSIFVIFYFLIILINFIFIFLTTLHGRYCFFIKQMRKLGHMNWYCWDRNQCVFLSPGPFTYIFLPTKTGFKTHSTKSKGLHSAFIHPSSVNMPNHLTICSLI